MSKELTAVEVADIDARVQRCILPNDSVVRRFARAHFFRENWPAVRESHEALRARAEAAEAALADKQQLLDVAAAGLEAAESEAKRLRELPVISEGFRFGRAVRKAVGDEADKKLGQGYLDWAAHCQTKRPLAAPANEVPYE